MLKRLSELKYRIDNSGTVTINLGDGGILKGSPTEFLVIANEIVALQTEKTRLQTAESVYLQVLKALDIPTSVVEEIQRRLHGELKTIEPEDALHAKAKDVKPEHIMLYQFVTAFVNSETNENEFEVEEFSVFDHEIKSLPKILGQYGFDVEINDKTIRVRLTGENNTNEQQRPNRNIES